MNKLLSIVCATALASVSVGSFAMSHGGAMPDKTDCSKMDPAKMDDKTKADCKKQMDAAKTTPAASTTPAPAAPAKAPPAPAKY
jgi:hypothetical protein